ncbi:hypothetical protein M093_1760 [Bacteroides uniformis str. 3978 T3 i]|nr:hypothetical protein M093_1760 [Bacteroides uniformis str. 3978 T3 i]
MLTHLNRILLILQMRILMAQSLPERWCASLLVLLLFT